MRFVLPTDYANQGERVADNEADVIHGERVVVEKRRVEAEKCGGERNVKTLLKPQEARKQKAVETLQRNSDGHLERLNAGASLKPEYDVGEPAPLALRLVRGIEENPRVGEGMVGKDQRGEKISIRDELQQQKPNEDRTVVRIQPRKDPAELLRYLISENCRLPLNDPLPRHRLPHRARQVMGE